MDTYYDWKPFEIHEGTCLNCGLRIYTDMEIMAKDDLEALRAERGDADLEDITYPDVDESRPDIQKFDEEWKPHKPTSVRKGETE